MVKGSPQRFWIITCTTIWSCYSYYGGIFFAHLLILEDLDHHQNLISSSLFYPGPLHKISSQSIYKSLSNVVHKQTDQCCITFFCQGDIKMINVVTISSVTGYQFDYRKPDLIKVCFDNPPSWSIRFAADCICTLLNVGPLWKLLNLFITCISDRTCYNYHWVCHSFTHQRTSGFPP